MRLLLDEHHSPEIARQLRSHGHDVLAVGEAGLEGVDDEELLERATDAGRALITNNARHLIPLSTRWAEEARTHAGVILTSDESLPRSSAHVGLYVEALEALIRDNPREDSLRNAVRWLSPSGR